MRGHELRVECDRTLKHVPRCADLPKEDKRLPGDQRRRRKIGHDCQGGARRDERGLGMLLS